MHACSILLYYHMEKMEFLATHILYYAHHPTLSPIG